MKKIVIVVLISLFFLSSCIAPVNLSFDSARAIDRGTLEFKGNISSYRIPLLENIRDNDSDNYWGNNNVGFEVGFGITDRYSLKLRYEYLKAKNVYTGPWLDLSDLSELSYFGMENKYKLKKANVAIGVPIGYYRFKKNSNADGFFIIDPTCYITPFERNNKFNISIIPKVHLFIIEGGLSLTPGISIGFGISNNLNNWAIRPEIGFDGYFSAGIGLILNPWNLIKIE